MGEAMKRLAEVKDSLDIDVKQNFIDPFQTIIDKDLKDIQVENCNQLLSKIKSEFIDVQLSIYELLRIVIKNSYFSFHGHFPPSLTL